MYSNNCYSGGCNCGFRENYSSTNYNANNLEEIISESREISKAPAIFYAPLKYLSGKYLSKPAEKFEFGADEFLLSNRPATIFVQDEEQSQLTMRAVKEAFKLMTKDELPRNLAIHILNEEDFRKAHSMTGQWSEGIMGFSINRQGRGANEVFAKKDHFDRLMLTIGHEIGHVMSRTLNNQHDEEAKAFAFSLAWMQTIVKNNIAGLSQNINPMPANNGLHNVAFEFVAGMIKKGQSAIDIFTDIILGRLKVQIWRN